MQHKLLCLLTMNLLIGGIFAGVVACSRPAQPYPNTVKAKLVFYNRSGADVTGVHFTGTHSNIHNLGFGNVIDDSFARNAGFLLDFPFPATIHWTTANGVQHQKSFLLNRVSPQSDLEIVEFHLDENGQLQIHQRAEYP